MASKIDSKTWIVIPAFNESQYIELVLRAVSKQTKNIIVADDGSSDDTVSLARKYTKHVLVHRINLGKGAALKTGCDYAFEHQGAQKVVLMDSDDQHDPAELSLFFNELKNGHDIIFGSRMNNSSIPIAKLLANKGLSLLLWLLFGAYVPDIPSGYKAFTKKAYETIAWDASGYEVEAEIAARVAKHKLSFSVVNIRTIYHDFDKGMTFLDAVQLLAPILNWRLRL